MSHTGWGYAFFHAHIKQTTSATLNCFKLITLKSLGGTGGSPRPTPLRLRYIILKYYTFHEIYGLMIAIHIQNVSFRKVL